MPRYFFNTRIGDELISDPDGEVLRDPDRAWEMARAMIRELLQTEGADGALLNATIEVTDDEGEIVLEFPFSEADSARQPRQSDHQALTARAIVRRYTARLRSIPVDATMPPCERCFRLQMCGQISETAVGKATGAGIMTCLREENGFRQGRTLMMSYSSASRSLLLAGAFFGAFTFGAAAQQPAAPGRRCRACGRARPVAAGLAADRPAGQ